MNPYDILHVLFNDDGYSNEFISISISDPVNINISKNENRYIIQFDGNRPVLKIKKILKVSIKISSIILEEESGVLVLDNFPDIPIKYEWLFPAEKE